MYSHSQTDLRPISSSSLDIVNSVVALPVAILVSWLPAAARERWRGLPLVLGTFLSSLLQIALVSWWFMIEYQAHVASAGVSQTDFMSVMHYAGFAIATPVGAAAIYGLAEGLIRLASAIIGEPLGTLPLWLVHRVARSLGGKDDASWAEVCRDVAIVRPDGTFEIRTCQPRDWDVASTIEYRSVFYRVVHRVHTDDERRPYFYRLESVPSAHLIRDVHRYSPDELL